MKKIFIYLLFISFAWGHPHTFINYKITQKDDNIRVCWFFDEMTSAMLLMEFDQDGDGKVSTKESAWVEKEYFSSLKDYEFYTRLHVEGKKQEFKPQNFRASIDGMKAVYCFDMTFPKKAKRIKLELYDTERFVAFMKKDSKVETSTKFKEYEEDRDFYLANVVEFEF